MDLAVYILSSAVACLFFSYVVSILRNPTDIYMLDVALMGLVSTLVVGVLVPIVAPSILKVGWSAPFMLDGLKDIFLTMVGYTAVRNLLKEYALCRVSDCVTAVLIAVVIAWEFLMLLSYAGVI